MPERQEVEGFDRVFDLVGGYGKFQWRLLLIIALQLVVATWHEIGYTFLGAVPKHWCLTEELKETNWTVAEIKRLSIPMKQNVEGLGEGEDYDQCHYYHLNYGSIAFTSDTFEEAFLKSHLADTRTLECKSWDFDRSTYKSTIPSEFELFCDWEWMTPMLQTSYLVGGMLGTLMFGAASDKYLGRRKGIIYALIIVIICGILISFITSYWILLFLRFLLSFGVSGATQLGFVLAMEHSDRKHRAILGMAVQVPFALGYMMLPILAYFIREWRTLQLTVAIISLTTLSYFWILPDSPRWLAMRGDEEEAINYLMKMATTNNLPSPTKEELLEIVRPCRKLRRVEEESNEETKQTYSEQLKRWARGSVGTLNKLWSTPEIRKRSFIFWTIFFSVSMVYYGLVFSAAELTSNPYLPVFLSGLTEIPAYVLTTPIVTKFGRKPTISGTFILTGVCLFGLSRLSSAQTGLRIVMAMLAKLFVTSTFATIYVLGAELYPTESRSIGFGVGMFFNKIGAVAATFIDSQLKTLVTKDFPSLIFSAIAIVAGLVVLRLHETKDLEMTDKVHEVIKQVAEIKERRRSKKNKADTIDGLTQL